MLCNASQHLWADLVTIVESENKIRPASAGKCFMRAGLPLDLPAQSQQRSKKAPGFD